MGLKPTYTTKPMILRIPPMRFSWLHVVLILLAIVLLHTCSRNNALDAELSRIDKVQNDTIQHYITKLGEQGATIRSYQGEMASLNAFLEDARDSTKQMERAIEKFRSIASAIKTETRTIIDSVEVPYIVEGKEFNVPFNLKEKFYGLNGRSTNKGLFIDRIEIPNHQSIVVGKRKSGFFSSEFRVDVVNSNPYVRTTGLSSYVHKEKVKRIGIGLYVGYGVGANGLSPQIGIGVNYSLLRI